MQNANIKKALDEATRAAKREKDPKKKLVLENMPLVISAMYKISQNVSIEEEVFQEGCKGLILAAENYDPEEGTKFGSYAVWYIRREISRMMAKYVYCVPQDTFYENMKSKREGGEVKVLDTVPMSYVEGGCSWYGEEDQAFEEIANHSTMTIDRIMKMPDRIRTIILMKFGFTTGGVESKWCDIGKALKCSGDSARVTLEGHLKRLRGNEIFKHRFEDLCRG